MYLMQNTNKKECKKCNKRFQQNIHYNKIEFSKIYTNWIKNFDE